MIHFSFIYLARSRYFMFVIRFQNVTFVIVKSILLINIALSYKFINKSWIVHYYCLNGKSVTAIFDTNGCVRND
ncbi:Uncharacterised protein [Klebsiella pneumoniae]|nr:hypothetical protein ECNIH2_25210 [Enterobacter cloacae ECNIH2]KSY38214.1 hypothetical protein APU03_25135 [Klebsiella pneumoniae]OCN11534.1 hypothetical protein AN701_0226410 [Serratia marcescens]CAE6397265.1 hypothetical protein AI2711V1_5073 [Raoultella ornithinolytica]OCN31996.1 hypothetical protein AN699_0226515 [Serratia marcescens]